MLDDYYLIGEIKSSYCDEGYLVVYSYSDFTDRFFDLNFVFIEIFGVIKKLFVDRVELSGEDVLIKFRNFNDSEIVNALIGCKIYVDEQNLIELEEGQYFVHDLIGCKVFYNNQFFGEVVDLYTLKSNDVYVVNDSEGKEYLIPAVQDYIKSVDADSKRIELVHDWKSMNYDED